MKQGEGEDDIDAKKAIKKYFPIFAADNAGISDRFPVAVYLGTCAVILQVQHGFDAQFVGLDNYVRIWSDGTFVHSLWFTAAFALVTVVLINVLAFAVALLLTKGFRGTNTFRTVFFMPNWIGHYPRVYLAADFQWYSCVGGADT